MRLVLLTCAMLVTSGLAHAGFAPYVGNYRLSDGRVVAIADWEADPSAAHVPLFTDFRSGRIGVLREAGPDTLVLSQGLMSGDDEARLRFATSGGRVVTLELQRRGETARRGVRMAIRSRDIRFLSDSLTLHGTIWLPPGRGPFPAIVIVPAGGVGRAAAAPFTHFFLSRGFAVMAYDRRPFRAPFPAYAGDAIAAVRAVRREPGVDSRRVGLWGHSQGGWLALMAAARSTDIAFVIDHSGMLVPAWQQELYRLRAEALADSVAVETVEEAVAFETRLIQVARTGQGWDDVASRLAVVPAPAWRALVYRPQTLDELQRVWRDDYSLDPRPAITGIRCPVLALYGGLDRSTPIESAAHLTHAMARGGSLEVDFFPTADHAFLEAVSGGNAEIARLSRFAPGMFDTLGSWLERRAVHGRESGGEP